MVIEPLNYPGRQIRQWDDITTYMYFRNHTRILIIEEIKMLATSRIRVSLLSWFLFSFNIWENCSEERYEPSGSCLRRGNRTGSRTHIEVVLIQQLTINRAGLDPIGQEMSDWSLYCGLLCCLRFV